MSAPLPTDDASPRVAALFFEGRYREVIAATVESAAPPPAEALPYAVGALAFAGRLLEAELLAPRVMRGGDPLAVSACAFCLAVAFARVGRPERAVATLREALRRTDGRRDATARAWLLQASACARYFAGRLGRAAVVAEAALGCALRGGFPYGAMLANDLRGHALAQSGDTTRGVLVLGHARDLAARLGYAANAATIELAATLYRARESTAPEAAALLTDAMARDVTQDSFSRRSLCLERATVFAWMGRATEAAAQLDEVTPRCAGERRLEALLELARVHVARVREGWDVAGARLAQLDARVAALADPALRVEAAALHLAAARARGDDLSAPAAELLALHAATGLRRARDWVTAWGAGGDDLTGLPPMLEAFARGSAVSVVRAGLLGLLPECARMPPARRVHVFDDALVVEHHGDLARREALTARARSLLDALACGRGAREALVREVWGLRVYAPHRHDGVVKTAVSRLRASLGEAGAWVEADDGAYRLARGVSVVVHDPRSPARHCLPAARPPASDRASSERQRRILDAVARAGHASVGDLSRRLGVPTRTLSRELTALCEQRLLARDGGGRSTTYRIP